MRLTVCVGFALLMSCTDPEAAGRDPLGDASPADVASSAKGAWVLVSGASNENGYAAASLDGEVVGIRLPDAPVTAAVELFEFRGASWTKRVVTTGSADQGSQTASGVLVGSKTDGWLVGGTDRTSQVLLEILHFDLAASPPSFNAVKPSNPDWKGCYHGVVGSIAAWSKGVAFKCTGGDLWNFDGTNVERLTMTLTNGVLASLGPRSERLFLFDDQAYEWKAGKWDPLGSFTAAEFAGREKQSLTTDTKRIFAAGSKTWIWEPPGPGRVVAAPCTGVALGAVGNAVGNKVYAFCGGPAFQVFTWDENAAPK